jgi:hypothetical protein
MPEKPLSGFRIVCLPDATRSEGFPARSTRFAVVWGEDPIRDFGERAVGETLEDAGDV